MLGVVILLGLVFALLPGGGDQDDLGKNGAKVATRKGSADPDRAAAEWVLGIGGTIETDARKIIEVGQLPKEPFWIVTVLLVFNRHVTDDNLEHLSELTKLTSLNLGATQVSDTGLKHLKGLTKLAILKLQKTKGHRRRRCRTQEGSARL